MREEDGAAGGLLGPQREHLIDEGAVDPVDAHSLRQLVPDRQLDF